MTDRVAELREEYDQTLEQLGETIAEHKSETALYGDSWPGAQLDIGRLQRAVSNLEGLLAAAKAEAAGNELEVKYASCGKMYRYTGMPRWSHTPKLAAIAWVRANEF